ncbi:hypothetical protein BD410DRAFT_780799 [Rickenella mellea]|uniref:Uncharacterized protein n=1 Tax=Rickenella mellea TaxID=50990 RepID=A0A4Y7QKY0_9AGAM|nr:hypothetical protein BD410DRAFT_780799 [Rickenella mellea]
MQSNKSSYNIRFDSFCVSRCQTNASLTLSSCVRSPNLSESRIHKLRLTLKS